ncbi:MAG: hypothetical protein N2422_10985 [Rhodobacteraceae bacterium]|nr:hypothetical protein [Paracoccaceae bacterium]
MGGFGDLVLAQLLDPLRIGLVIGLVLTMFRTRAVTGTVVPLLAGIVFVALILPLTTGAASGVPVLRAFAAGLVSTGLLTAVAVAAGLIILRLRR